MEDAGRKDLKARGLLFKILVQWLAKEHGLDPTTEFSDDLEPETLEILERVDKGGWYPVNHLASALLACSDNSGFSEGYLQEFGAYLCDVSLTTSFRGLIVFIDPVTLMKRMPLFWRRYFNGAELHTCDVGGNTAGLSIEKVQGAEVVYGMFSGWLKRALEMVGADQISVKGENPRWDVSWQWTGN